MHPRARSDSPENVTCVAGGYLSFVVDLSQRQHHVPILPDGLVVVVKEECDTCRMVAPLLRQLVATVYTQDDPSFPEGVAPIYDADLSVSWHHSIETVPTLIRVVDRREVERTVGWLRSEWQRITRISTLGDDLPVTRPGRDSL